AIFPLQAVVAALVSSAELSKQALGTSASTTMIPPELLLQGYRLGIFPMAMEDDSIEWFSPERRGIIPLETFHLPHGARRTWARKSFEVRIDTAFPDFIRACGRR